MILAESCKLLQREHSVRTTGPPGDAVWRCARHLIIVDGGSIRTYVSANALAFISERVPQPHEGTTANQTALDVEK